MINPSRSWSTTKFSNFWSTSFSRRLISPSSRLREKICKHQIKMMAMRSCMSPSWPKTRAFSVEYAVLTCLPSLSTSPFPRSFTILLMRLPKDLWVIFWRRRISQFSKFSSTTLKRIRPDMRPNARAWWEHCRWWTVRSPLSSWRLSKEF